MPQRHTAHNAMEGFTLVELSIVLIVIGLVVGGILVGRDLIEAARIRAQVSQIEKYDSAMAAFKLKYGALPGDITASMAAAFGLTVRSGSFGAGDGDGFISTNVSGCDVNTCVGGENLLFWSDLSSANLIDGSFTTATEASPGGALTESQIPLYLPTAKLTGNYVTIFNTRGMTSPPYNSDFWWVVIGMDQVFLNGSYIEYSLTPRMSSLQAVAIDNKIDDGNLNRGRVIGVAPTPGVSHNLTDNGGGCAAPYSATWNCGLFVRSSVGR